MNATSDLTDLPISPRAGCEGVLPLSARLEPWQLEQCRQARLVGELLEAHGSPLNLIHRGPMARNTAELEDAAVRLGVDLGIYFARKANKALAFVDEAARLGLGLDLASEQELIQVLKRGAPARGLIMSAAVKPASLLELCIASGTTIVLDNTDELRQVVKLAESARQMVSVALRLAPTLGDQRPGTRFGFGFEEALATIAQRPSNLTIEGAHFHLDGYESSERVIAIAQAFELIDALRQRGHEPTFIDIGGGIPISYLESSEQWERFWEEHRRGLLGQRAPLTFAGHGLGLIAHNGEIIGRPAVYPYHQSPTRGSWLTNVLTGTVVSRNRRSSVAEGLRERGLQLRCEPGRALLDGCGLTVARVTYRKRRRDGTFLIGVEMNRTQCRSTSDDFLVDPLLINPEAPGQFAGRGAPTGPIEGYLVGAYCIERELLTWRRLKFPNGVGIGDIVVFPNTAGYLMHILESSSHQMPLARNLVIDSGQPAFLDAIDMPP